MVKILGLSLVVALGICSFESHGFESLEFTDLVSNKKHKIEFVHNSAKQDKEQRTLFVFMSTKCPCSESYIPVLKKLRLEYAKDSKLKFYGVHSNSEELKAKSYFTEKELGFAVLDDSKQQLLNRLGALKTPHAFILNSKGEVIYHGGIGNSRRAEHSDKNHLKRALSQGATPKPSFSKSLGCYIKRI